MQKALAISKQNIYQNVAFIIITMIPEKKLGGIFKISSWRIISLILILHLKNPNSFLHLRVQDTHLCMLAYVYNFLFLMIISIMTLKNISKIYINTGCLWKKWTYIPNICLFDIEMIKNIKWSKILIYCYSVVTGYILRSWKLLQN